jgi:hypothetical protein
MATFVWSNGDLVFVSLSHLSLFHRRSSSVPCYYWLVVKWLQELIAGLTRSKAVPCHGVSGFAGKVGVGFLALPLEYRSRRELPESSGASTQHFLYN